MAGRVVIAPPAMVASSGPLSAASRLDYSATSLPITRETRRQVLVVQREGSGRSGGAQSLVAPNFPQPDFWIAVAKATAR